MIHTQQGTPFTNSPWDRLAGELLKGRELTPEEGLGILQSPDEEVLFLLSGAYRLRREYFGNDVQLYLLMNAKSGLCPEDCSYCSQSKVSEAEIPRYNLLNEKKLLDGARMAYERQAKTYCIVISARGPSEREMAAITTLVPRIKEQFPLKICACLGLLTDEQARQLKECGVDRVNHNLNTGRDHYGEICSTHSYQDRLDTLHAVRNAGLEMCSGGIVGMGEADQDIVDMALELRRLRAESIPVNFLNPIDGTPLEGIRTLTPRHCLRVLCLFRYANRDSEIRIAGGREMHLRSLQPLGLFAANSIFVGDYLTTQGQPPREDYAMIEDLGFRIVRQPEPVAPLGGLSSETDTASSSS